MKKLLLAAALLLASTAAHASVVLTISGGVCAGTFDNSGVLTITSCTIPVASVTGAAPLASPALTGTPTVPTASASTNTTQAASTAMVQAAITAAAPTAYPVVATASLPAVTASNKGAVAFATDCRNSGQSAGAGTGCLVVVNTAGTWIAVWSGVAPTT